MGSALHISEIMFVVLIATGGDAVLGVLSLDVAIILSSSACIALGVALTDPESTTLGTLATST